MPAEDAVLVLDRMAERHMRGIVHQRSQAQHARLLFGNTHARLGIQLEGQVDGIHDALRHVQRADRVVKTRVHRSGEHQEGGAQLLDAAQALHLGRIKHPHLLVGQVNVPVHGIPHHAIALSSGHSLHCSGLGKFFPQGPAF